MLFWFKILSQSQESYQPQKKCYFRWPSQFPDFKILENQKSINKICVQKTSLKTWVPRFQDPLENRLKIDERFKFHFVDYLKISDQAKISMVKYMNTWIYIWGVHKVWCSLKRFCVTQTLSKLWWAIKLRWYLSINYHA